MRFCGNEYLVFEQPHQHGRVGPRFKEFGSLGFVLRRRDLRQPDVFFNMGLNESFDLWAGNVQSIFEDPVKQQALTILFGLGALEIDEHRINAVNLLICLRLIVADRRNQHEQIGAVIGDLG